MALNLREAALLERTRFDAARLRLNRYGGGLGGGLGGFSPYGRPGLGLGFGSGLGSPLGGLGLGLGGINIVV